MFTTLNRQNTRASKWRECEETLSKTSLAFSKADSDYRTAPAIIKALAKRSAHGAFGYTDYTKEDASIVIDWLKRRHHVVVDAAWLIPTQKILTALSLLLRTFTAPKESVVIQSPVYHNFYSIIEDNDRTVLQNPLISDENLFYTMDYNHLEQCFKDGAKTMILCHPHNPVGRVWQKEELHRLALLCERYGVLLISDEVHSDIIMPGQSFHSLIHEQQHCARLVVIHSLSKTFNLAGLQLSHLIIPNQAMNVTIQSTLQAMALQTPNVFALEAMRAAYTQCDAWVDAQNQHIQQNLAWLKKWLTPYSKVTLAPLEGTYLAWLDASSWKLSTDEIHRRFKEAGVIICHGSQYADCCEGFLRINLACSKEQLIKGFKRLAPIFKSLENSQ